MVLYVNCISVKLAVSQKIERLLQTLTHTVYLPFGVLVLVFMFTRSTIPGSFHSLCLGAHFRSVQIELKLKLKSFFYASIVLHLYYNLFNPFSVAYLTLPAPTPSFY